MQQEFLCEASDQMPSAFIFVHIFAQIFNYILLLLREVLFVDESGMLHRLSGQRALSPSSYTHSIPSEGSYFSKRVQVAAVSYPP